ncbi:MAG TPA: signal recognition particle protein, partial [Deinococcales bacterium]|nr:signal recognition particle protein [Deinococcales bacterium]
MFESLGKRLQDILDNLRGRGRLTEADLKTAMREVRVALLEADVNFQVAREFIAAVQEKALGQDVLGSLTPGQQVIKIVHDELIETLGGKATQPELRDRGNVWFMVGLQGAGKTTTAGKLANLYKSKGRRVLMVAADTQRPAAREQLAVLGKQVGVPVLAVNDNESPQRTRERLDEYLRTDYRDLILVDTAGRLQIDEALMDALADLKGALSPTETFLVVDAMTGQEALGVSRSFDERIGVTGLIMTKLDGDARGGAALSARHVTGKPIVFAGVSEKISGLEPFYPDRVAGRILGMGDVLGLIERAQAADVAAFSPKKPGDFDFEDLVTQLRAIQRMGPITDVIKMIPGMSRMIPEDAHVDDKELKRIEAIISSMTLQERRNPKVIDGRRRRRIAAGAGVPVQQVNRLVKMHDQMKDLMRLMTSPRGRNLQ